MGATTATSTTRLDTRESPRIGRGSSFRMTAVTLAVGLAGAFVAAPAVGAAAPAKKKPPVALSGTVNVKGTAKVKHDKATVAQGDFFFKKTFLKAKAGTTIAVTIENKGQSQHTFTTDDPAGGSTPMIDEQLSPGETTTVDVTIPADGSAFVFYCRFHVGSGMQGALFSKAGTKAAESDRKKASTGGGRYEPSSGGSGY